jgi:hypothetical protein
MDHSALSTPLAITVREGVVQHTFKTRGLWLECRNCPTHDLFCPKFRDQADAAMGILLPVS